MINPQVLLQLEQQSGRQAQALAQQLRHKLVPHGRQLAAQLHRIHSKETNPIALAIAVGEAKQFIAFRDMLTPGIGTDGYTRDIRGLLTLLQRKLTELSAPTTPIKDAHDE